jgi:hypothetical protein
VVSGWTWRRYFVDSRAAERERLDLLRAAVALEADDPFARHEVDPATDSTRLAIAIEKRHVLDDLAIVRTEWGYCWQLTCSSMSVARARDLVWSAAVGPVPKGVVLVPKCGNRCCLSPRHCAPRLHVSYAAAPSPDAAVFRDEHLLCSDCRRFALNDGVLLVDRFALDAFLVGSLQSRGAKATADLWLAYTFAILNGFAALESGDAAPA